MIFLNFAFIMSNRIMDKQQNKYIAVAYKLYAEADGEREFVEEATKEKPFVFISGFGETLPRFEELVAGLATGDEFDFTLSPDDAYGDYVDERVLELDKAIFSIDGKFDDNHFLAQVVSVGDDKVTVDLNHPLAGQSLNFKGQVVESHEATNHEIEQMTQRSCSGHCGDCSGCE